MKPKIVKTDLDVVTIISDYEREKGIYIFKYGGQPKRAINLGLTKTIEGFPCVRYAVPGESMHALLVVDELTQSPYVFRWVCADQKDVIAYLAA